uniref:Uncharacterized protein n=1 Tax=Candidatus Kentrum sp. LPFa TaxID=2126335 RepID=A0A450XJE0_9GAMM|nr:MAG: hypothetical protein BECKLPF1236A_GA0070988_1005310 [Candidatus Kentron sp. LPFa]VFK29401.1 MAG: hypothetical protein BECKLPF1236C_GA0070990_100867 [Candidatus Kentron sp. LPFa]
MGNKKAKWLIYTVLVGLIPILSRLIVWFATKEGTVEILSSSDFIVFGLVLHISNINEIEHYSSLDEAWKTFQNGVSILFIVIYSIFLSLTLIDGNLVDLTVVTSCTMVLAFFSFLIGYSVYDRISKIDDRTC